MTASTLRFGRRKGMLQELFIDCMGLRKEVKEQGFTFEGFNEYLEKYHGVKGFQLVDAIRTGPDFVLHIRYLSLVQRIREWMRRIV